jgi:hypothetical protein
MPLFHDQQEHIEGFPRERLHDLVKNDDARTGGAQRFGDLPASSTRRSRAGAGQARDGMPLPELAHVEAGTRRLAAEHELRERLVSSVLPTPVGPRR